MFQIAMPALKVAAPFIVKGAIVGAKVLLATIAVGLAVDTAMEAAAESREDTLVKEGKLPEPEQDSTTFAQKVSGIMKFTGKSALDTTITSAASCLVLGVGVAVTPVNPVLGGYLVWASFGVLIANMAAWRYRANIANFFRSIARSVKNTAAAIWYRIRPKKADDTTPEEAALSKQGPIQHDVRAADEPDPVGASVSDGINANFDELADEDEAREKAAFKVAVQALLDDLVPDEIATAAKQTGVNYFNALPRGDKDDYAFARRQLVMWLGTNRTLKPKMGAITNGFDEARRLRQPITVAV